MVKKKKVKKVVKKVKLPKTDISNLNEDSDGVSIISKPPTVYEEE